MARNVSGKKASKLKPPFKCIEGHGSEAWKKLTRNGIFVINIFYEKYNGNNRNNLSAPYEEAKPKISNRLFSAGIWETIGFGFIDIVSHGGLKREATIYRFSNRWRKISEEPGKLDKIEDLLKQIEKIKREKSNIKKRMKIRELKKKVLELARR